MRQCLMVIIKKVQKKVHGRKIECRFVLIFLIIIYLLIPYGIEEIINSH